MDHPDPAEAVRMLDLILAFFGDGEGWTRGALNDGRGGRCLLGALQYIECECRVSGASAGAYPRDAIRHPAPGLEMTVLPGLGFLPDADFFPVVNDTSSSFVFLRAVIAEARDRAQADLSCRASADALAA
jgi:hypothetical protein